MNFITKQDFTGLDINLQYGQTSRSDGDRQEAEVTFGINGDRGNLVAGGSFNRQDEVSAGDRAFSKYATYFYGSIFNGGSSRNVTGRINLPDNLLTQIGGPGGCDSGSVTRVAGSAGDSIADFRCWEDPGDRYNFQPANLLITPQDRGTLFLLGHFDINDKLEFFSEVLYNRTHSGFKIASLPFTATSDDVVISADNIYNPFGIDFGGIAGLNENGQWRLEALGQRRNEVTTYTSRAVAGLRGSLFNTSWEWEGSGTIGRMDQETTTRGYLFKPALTAAFGPSFIAGDGTPTCGTPTEPINGCVPVNIFNLEAPGQAEALTTIGAQYDQSYGYRTTGLDLGTNGDLFDMPAGPLQAAIGVAYQKLEGNFDTDYNTQAQAPLFLTCQLAADTCTADAKGDYNVREVYAEVHVPLLKDLPAVHSLDFTAGTRYSDYSKFGDTTNSTFKLEYRPISDMLVRASFSEVFRVPTIYNLYQGPTHDAPTFIDPCNSLTSAALAANPNLAAACVGVAPDTGFTQPNSQIEAVRVGNVDLSPETGDVLTYGIIYDPSWLSGLSLNVDFWHYKVDNLITRVDPNFTSEQCVATGDPLFCGLINRYTSGPNQGEVFQGLEPFLNLGKLKTEGFDLGIKYQLRNTGLGSFRFTVDSSYTKNYKNTPSDISLTQDYAGTYSTTFGNYAKWRALGGIGWSLASFDGLLTARYIHKLKIEDADGGPGVVPLNVPKKVYLNLTLGYEFATKTKVQLGVINLGDTQPPFMYFNNTINANTDVSTYDTLGRQYWVGVRQQF